MSTLDRYILRTALARWVGIVFLGTFLLLLGDFVGKVGFYLRVLGSADAWMVVLYYLYRLPEFLRLWLPLSCAATALLCASPMLRQGTLLVLAASGVPPRRVFAVLIPFALVTGVIGFVIADQALPHLNGPAEALDERMALAHKNNAPRNPGRPDPVGWRHGDTFWCVDEPYPHQGRFDRVTAFAAASDAHPTGMQLSADVLRWTGERWELQGLLLLEGVRPPLRLDQAEPGALGFALPRDRRSLALLLRPADEKTSQELLAQRSLQSNHQLTIRVLGLLLPMLCLLFALPRFIRWESRSRIGVITIQAVLLALLPVAVLAIAGRLLVSSGGNPALLGGGIIGAMLVVGVWRWWRMSL